MTARPVHPPVLRAAWAAVLAVTFVLGGVQAAEAANPRTASLRYSGTVLQVTVNTGAKCWEVQRASGKAFVRVYGSCTTLPWFSQSWATRVAGRYRAFVPGDVYGTPAYSNVVTVP